MVQATMAGALPALLGNPYAIILCRAVFGLPVAASTTAASP